MTIFLAFHAETRTRYSGATPYGSTVTPPRRLLGLISPKRYAYPALDITLPGDRRLHLVGSIHMGTVDMSPLPSRLAARLQQADALIVEADITDSASPFDHAELQPALEQRLSAEEYQRLLALCHELGADPEPSSPCPAGRSR